ncbi:putative signal transducing protein [Candidatus Thiodiazotropha sp. CDECU1]|uniref:putative signal transducing protein n=1 Tax=Candidatus Thiodiazotropha sp. CDECU1 TaxID=3065865 RepID=UPI002931639E|nr:DUF2007 domain-containing protein [Candidatus Thiodiazotropha sp. CDECU1]
MRELYQAADRVEAQILKDHLQVEGIETVIVGDQLSGAVGELPADIYPTLWVLDDDDLARAKQLTEQYFSRPPVSGQRWRCRVCGESIDAGFEICWNCGSPGPNDNE